MPTWKKSRARPEILPWQEPPALGYGQSGFSSLVRVIISAVVRGVRRSRVVRRRRIVRPARVIRVVVIPWVVRVVVPVRRVVVRIRRVTVPVRVARVRVARVAIIIGRRISVAAPPPPLRLGGRGRRNDQPEAGGCKNEGKNQ